MRSDIGDTRDIYIISLAMNDRDMISLAIIHPYIISYHIRHTYRYVTYASDTSRMHRVRHLSVVCGIYESCTAPTIISYHIRHIFYHIRHISLAATRDAYVRHRRAEKLAVCHWKDEARERETRTLKVCPSLAWSFSR